MKNEPQTRRGEEAWDLVVRNGGQLRLGGMGGVVGLDMTAVYASADALGYDRRAAALLVPMAERGLVKALNSKDKDDNEEEPA